MIYLNLQTLLNMGEIMLIRAGVGCKWTSADDFAIASLPVSQKKNFKHEMMKEVSGCLCFSDFLR